MILQGHLHRHIVKGTSLAGNPLGDPSDRVCLVYTPPGYDAEKHYPLLVDLAPYTSSGLARAGWKNFYKSIPEIIEDMILKGTIPPVVVAFPDTFTKLGGTQHINSPAMGNYADFIIKDVLPYVESQFSCGGKGCRGVYGYSSGGYAALVYGMQYPEVWDVIACHSGDMGFDLAYLYDMPSVMMYFERFNYNSKAFLDHFWSQGRPSGQDIHLLMMLAMSASYDPEACDLNTMSITLPVDPYTMALNQDRWQKWLAHDPLVMSEHHLDALRSLKKIFIDCGNQDQYRLQYGARKLSQKLSNHKIPHIYQDFEGTHLGIEDRLTTSLPLILPALKAQ